MIGQNLVLKNISTAVLSFFCVKITSLFKISFIVGSSMAFFSGSSIAIPLIGALGGAFYSFIVFGLSCLIRGLMGNLGALHSLAYHIPGLCGALYFQGGLMIRVILPLSCMVAFIAHPIGAPAYFYTFYWLIPVAVYYLGSSLFFLHALSSTFVAHAVGSVIWIYTVPMSSLDWVALIPIVAVERLLCATGMVLLSLCVQSLWAKRAFMRKIKITSTLKA